jgi:enoyl-CoA hydratase
MRGMENVMPPAEGTITTERRGPLLLIGINRPAKRNGFTPRMFRELAQAYTLLDDEPALRVGVLFAHGDHFTAGLDLPTIAPSMHKGEKLWPQDAVEPLNLGTPGYRRRTKPMVVAVQGITFTLGIELMLAADIVVASEDCRFSQLEVKRGIMATGGATLRIANAVAEQAPLAVTASRLNALKAVERGPLEAMAEFVSVQQRLSRTEDAAEGVKSFVEKRPARFTGR